MALLGEYYMNNLLVLYNDQELADFLARRIMIRLVQDVEFTWDATDQYVEEQTKIFKKTRILKMDGAYLAKVIQSDCKNFYNQISIKHKRYFRKLQRFIIDRIPQMSSDEIRKLMEAINKTNTNTLVEKTACTLADTITVGSRLEAYSPVQVSIVRNILNNEDYLKDKLTRRNSFYFIDSGYTNFLVADGNKRWHRLVKNNIHLVPDLNQVWPTDRLELLESFPRRWHRKGSRILIVDSSDSHHRVFNSSRSEWRKTISRKVESATNKEVYFKSKDLDRKTRVSVWDMLQDDPTSWYCVITDSSAAAVEAVWMGIPVITLKPHVTTPIARDSIEHINNLNYCNIGNWLCALTYSQFTYNEMVNGFAAKTLKKYYNA